MKFIVIQDSTGEVLRTGEVPSGDTISFNAQAGLGESVYDNTADYDFTYYRTGGAFVLRPDFDATNALVGVGSWLANGSDQVTYGSSLPNPTSVKIFAVNSPTGVELVSITDGSLEVTANYPGIYRIELSAFPYLDKIIEVTAT